ncbi:MAG: bifunctional DNA-formamidopyrimidine glycosylase/DNA-(apurinic or apyrimidinic site) lyase [Fuerstiella sp.]
MPELPEVETMVRGLRPEIEGRTIIELEFCECTRRPIQVSPSPGRFRKQVAGQQIRSVWRLAKRVVVELSAVQYIVIEPRMTGLMLVSRPPTTEHRRLCWHMAPKRGKCRSFEFWDRRGLGTARLLDGDQMAELQRTLGPDALRMSVEEWKRQLSRTSRPIKVAMLDQKLIAGIGNLYASEILHEASVSPKRSSQRLTKKQLSAIQAATSRILQEAIQYEGSTLGDGTYRNALNKDGGYQNKHQVYQKEGEPCQKCGVGVIKRIVQAQRSTFYCAQCQR